MKTTVIIKVICIQFILLFGQSSIAQRIDYRSEGCSASIAGPSPSSYQIIEKMDLSDSDEIWKAMEELTFNMIDLEVEVIHLRALEMSLIPFNHLPTPTDEDWDEEDYDPMTQVEMEEIMEDKVLYELLQMRSHLQNLVDQVSNIKSEVSRFRYYDTQSDTTMSDPEIQIGNPLSQHGSSTIEVWKEIEEMAIQAMDLEVEVSDLRLELVNLKRNAWEIDQMALLKSQERN